MSVQDEEQRIHQVITGKIPRAPCCRVGFAVQSIAQPHVRHILYHTIITTTIIITITIITTTTTIISVHIYVLARQSNKPRAA